MPTTLRPNAPGWVTQLSIQFPNSDEHWDKVDEVTADEDATYVQALQSSSATQYDGYGLENLPAGVGTITNLVITARLKKTNTNVNRARIGVYHPTSGGGGGYWSSVIWLTTSYGTQSKGWAISPFTGSAWTEAEVNGLQAAIELKGNPGGGADTAGRCTQVYVVVTYNVSPTVTTQAVSDILATTATGNGNITDLGDGSVTQHGVCWNTGGTPTTADSKTEEGAAGATGAFTSSMTGLLPNTLYYVRAYATNSIGTSYGSEVSFTTLTTGYPKVQII